MRKIWSLYINELLKIARRIVFSVMAVAMIIIMVIAGAIFNASNRYSYYVDYYNDMSEVYKSEIEFYEERIEECKASLRGIAEQFDGWVKENEASSDAEGAALYFYGSIEELYYSCSNLYRYELWLRHDVKERYDDTFYKNECIDKLADCRASEEVKNFINTLEQEIPGFREYNNEYGYLSAKEFFERIDCDKAEAEEYGRILESGKYSEFIAYKNRLIEQSDYSDDTKRLMIETNNMLLQVNPEGEELTRELREVVQGINSYANYMTMAMEGMSDAGKLTDDEIEEMRLTAQEIKLSIDINAVGYGAAQSKDELGYAKNVIAIGTAVASVIIILISATMISEEIQSGSIKALIISPVKRSKIFAAKLMAIVTVCLLMIALIALTFTAINIIFGFGSSPIVYTAFGRAHSIAYYPYMFARIAIAFIDIFVYASMALMFSAITRNSAVSICITMFDYLAVSNIVKIICCNTDTITGNLVALFMPKVNMELAERLFRQMLPQSESGSLLELLTGGSDCAYGPLWFSIVYLAVLTFCFLYIAFDSFCRRDIK